MPRLYNDDGTNKSVALSGECLNKRRAFWVVLKCPTNLPDRGIDAVVDVHEDVLAPQSFDDFAAGDEPPLAFHQEHEEFHGNALQLDGLPSAR
jgi:hypothetical protein